jgi:hypothetical protein
MMTENYEGMRRYTAQLGEASPDITRVEMSVWPNGRGYVKVYRRNGFPLTIPIPWKDGDRWAITEDME